MSTLFPTAIDDTSTLPDPTNSSYQNNPDHVALHGNENAAVKALETKLGIGASVPANNTFLVGNGAGSTAYATASSVRTILGLGGLATLAVLPSGLLKGNGSDTTVVAATAGSDYLTPSGAETITNHDMKSATNTFASVTTITSSATPTATGDSRENELYITALAAAAAFAVPTGSPANGNRLLARVKDNGTPQGLSYNGIFRAVGITFPTTTVGGKTLYILFIYNSADSKWDGVATGQEA